MSYVHCHATGTAGLERYCGAVQERVCDVTNRTDDWHRLLLLLTADWTIV